MWESDNSLELPPDVAAVTTSVWLYPGIMLVGVMRSGMLAPPYLWAQVLHGGLRNLRKAPALLTELQHYLYAPIVYAEAECHIPRNQALLRYLGFEEIPAPPERKLYKRSI